MNIDIHFRKTVGAIKPLHGVNRSPIRFQADKIEEFEAAGIPFVRTHDCGGAYGRGTLVDVPNIFRDFEADENSPDSYDFSFTDRYLSAIVNAGAQPFFRLGVTIENNWRIRAYRIAPPKDFGKWARICEHIIRHYNDGWANGFHWGIQYWEIWNEPENPPMWQGTREQYFDLYVTASRHLKQCFPEIRVGGYAGCGFYAITREGMNDFYKSFIPWFEAFLAYVREYSAPLDFYSFHLYTDDAREIVTHADYVRLHLDNAGFANAEIVFDEWNYAVISRDALVYDYDEMKELPGALFVAEAFCRMQNSSIDKAMFYDAEPTSAYCGLFYFPNVRTTPTYQAFVAFDRLYQLGRQAYVAADLPDTVVDLAATDGDVGRLMLVNRGTRDLELPYSCDLALDSATIECLSQDGHFLTSMHCFWKEGIMLLPRQTLLVLEVHGG
ncbi:MAG: hypothetical protein IJJ33_05605 [Victivallales bacterium]|nr:hypothetical protein [Victivallales bacterium]